MAVERDRRFAMVLVKLFIERLLAARELAVLKEASGPSELMMIRPLTPSSNTVSPVRRSLVMVLSPTTAGSSSSAP